MSRPYFDRTAEFRSAVESAAFRAASSAQGAPLLSNGSGQAGGALKNKTAQRSEFARMAAKIGKDIQATTGKLEKLAQREFSLELGPEVQQPRQPACSRRASVVTVVCEEVLTMTLRLQSPSGKRSLTTDQSRSA